MYLIRMYLFSKGGNIGEGVGWLFAQFKRWDLSGKGRRGLQSLVLIWETRGKRRWRGSWVWWVGMTGGTQVRSWSLSNSAFEACGLDFMPPLSLSCLWWVGGHVFVWRLSDREFFPVWLLKWRKIFSAVHKGLWNLVLESTLSSQAGR